MTDKKPLLTDEEIEAIVRDANRYACEQTGDDSFEWQAIRDERFAALVAERAAAAEREAIILLADEMDVERTEYCMNVYEEGEQYKHNLLDAIRARSKA